MNIPEHRQRLDCETKTGAPQCYGAAVYGPERCTCDTLTDEQHARCVEDAWADHETREGVMCHDCAFRAGSPEHDEIDEIAARPVPFRCHQGMPVRCPGGVPETDSYCPRVDDLGRANDYPICAGWLRARARRSA